MKRITVAALDALKPKPAKPGERPKARRVLCGDTLYLVVEPGGSKHWIQRLMVNGRRRDIGLGSYRFVTLSEARQRAWDNLSRARRGELVGPQARIPTFRAVADRVAAQRTWKGRTGALRAAALATYCAGIMDTRIDRLDKTDVLDILVPIWTEKHEAAKRLRGWMRGVFEYAEAQDWVTRNPAGESINGALPKVSKATKHHSATDYRTLPATLAQVAATDRANDNVKLCIRFVALTACRSSEARLADWSEINFDAREWRIPADRMKTGQTHRVPLSDAAVDVLRATEHRDGFVFANGNRKALAPATLLAAWKRATGTDTTVHGSIRAGFRTWVDEQTSYTRDVAEKALAHAVGSDVERSYARSTLFDKRRELMQDWAAFLSA